MKKNDIVTLDIVDMTAKGSGIGRYENMAVFVPLTAPGDKLRAKIVKVKKTYAYGIIEELLEASGSRIEVDCKAFKQCGGCVYRHIDYQEECKIKTNKVEQAIKRIGGIDLSSQPIISAKELYNYRNKAQYPIDKNGQVGFYAVHSHRIIECEDCLLQPQEFSVAAKALTRWINQYKISVYDEESHSGLLRHFYLRKGFRSGEIMAVLVINGDTVPHIEEFVELLKGQLGESLKSVQININKNDTNVVLGNECRVVWGSEYIYDTLCDIKVRLSPLSFYQVNRDMAEILYKKAAQYADCKDADILDLYCGAGTIGLSLANTAKSVIGVEIVPQAVEDAKANARLNKIENARFICSDAALAAKQLKKEGITPQCVIVDPPRKGCEESLLRTIALDFAPQKLVYVSCDAATLARDAAILGGLGYKLCEYTPVDLFPRTCHIETVALFVRTVSAI